jgi:hypothetical protein
MAEFQAPNFQNPDLLGSYLRGQQGATQAAMAPLQMQGAQQDIQAQGLQMAQMRMALQKQGMLLDTAQQIGNLGQPGQPGQPAQSPAPAGQAPDQPQGAPPSSGDPLNDVMADRRNALYQKMDLLANRDPFTTQKLATQNALEQKKLQLQGPMNLAERVATDPQANIVIANNPQLLQQWKGWAAQHGLNPADPTSLTVANAQRAASDFYAQLSAQVGQAPKDFGYSGILKPGEVAYKGGQQVASAPDSMTAYQAQELKLRRDELAAKGSETRKPQLVDVPMPDGTTQKQWIVPGHDQGLNVGAPEAAKPGQGMGRVQQMVGRLTLAGNEVTKAAENLMKLGINTDSGWLGIANPQHGGILTSMKNALTNEVSKEDTKAYGIMVSGVKRNLAAIEAAGNMPPGSLTAQMDQVELKPGDTQINKLQRMAEIRQISQAGLESMLTQPGLSKQQIEQIQGINDRMTKAIPFTQEDILNLQQSKNPHLTINDMAKSTGVTGQASTHAVGETKEIGGFKVTRVN